MACQKCLFVPFDKSNGSVKFSSVSKILASTKGLLEVQHVGINQKSTYLVMTAPFNSFLNGIPEPFSWEVFSLCGHDFSQILCDLKLFRIFLWMRRGTSDVFDCVNNLNELKFYFQHVQHTGYFKDW